MGIFSKKTWFKDKSSKWHLFRGTVVTIIFMGLMVLAENSMPSIFISVLIPIIVVAWITFPVVMEFWDKYKISYSDPRVEFENWHPIIRSVFTSEGRFDKHDMLMDYMGYCLALVAGVLIGRLLL